MTVFDGPDIFEVPCSEAIDLFGADLSHKALILSAAQEDGLVQLLMLKMLFLMVGDFRGEQTDLLL